MAKHIKQVSAETIYTVELTQKELNTLVRFLGNTDEHQHKEIIHGSIGFVNVEKLMNYEEATALFHSLRVYANY
jgi:hypothetical protein